MNRFIIVDGLPFLYAKGKAYAVRWDNKGFTVGAEVELDSVPTRTYSELSIKAKCRILDSIQDKEPEAKQEAEQVVEPEAVQAEPEAKQEAEQVVEPEAVQAEPEAKPAFGDMKLEDLKKYASDNGITLKGARTKAEIIEAIKSASKE